MNGPTNTGMEQRGGSTLVPEPMDGSRENLIPSRLGAITHA